MSGYGSTAIPALGLTEGDFLRLSDFIRTEFGINLSPAKKVMLESRLRKRVAAMGCDDFGDYVEYILSDGVAREELSGMVDAVCTNKTDFFREPAHFTFLETELLPSLWNAGKGDPGHGGCLRVWSAACSTGEEPYSLAMALMDFKLANPAFEFGILATDLSGKALETARTAVYPEERIEPVEMGRRKRYLLRGTGEKEGTVRIRAELRSRIDFRRANLTDEGWDSGGGMDIVFLRNVIIYFDKETKRKVVELALGRMKVGGYLFLGHSETLFDMDLPVEMVRPTVYRRMG